MAYNRPIVLTFAGFDPCGGAGLLADIKTLEQNRCLGFGVLTALTRQTEDTFESVEWLSLDSIIRTALPLFDRYTVAAIKIGIMRDLPMLLQLVHWIRHKAPAAHVVWDTVLASSTGFAFVDAVDRSAVVSLLREVTLATPNIPEALALSGKETPAEALAWLASHGAVLVKGGHAAEEPGVDYLYAGGGVAAFKSEAGMLSPKHGSGCILSAAIAAGMAQGLSMAEACRQGKQYVEKALGSNTGLLAYHNI